MPDPRPRYGTAPHLEHGVWVTIRGTRLAPAGQRYWTNLHRQGRTDGLGHMTNRAGVGGTAQAQEVYRPPTVVGASPQQAAEATYLRRHPRIARQVERQAVTQQWERAAGEAVSKPKLQQAGAFIPSNAAKFVTDTAGQIGNAFYNIPAAGYYTGEALGQDIRDTAHGHPTSHHTSNLAKGFGKGFIAPFEHPIGDRGLLLLQAGGVVGAVAGTAARLGAAGSEFADAAAAARAAGQGRYVNSAAAARSPWVEAAKALMRKPEPKMRTLQFGDFKVHPEPSRNPARRYIQEKYDKALMKAAQENPGGFAEHTLVRKVGRELQTEHRYRESLERAAPGVLAQHARQLTKAQETALRVVAEGQPIAARIAEHRAEIASTKSPKVRRNLNKKITLLNKARQYVVGGPHDAPQIVPELKPIFDEAAQSAKRRTKLGIKTGMFTRETARGRVHAPGRGIAGAQYLYPQEAKARIRAITQSLGRLQKQADNLNRSAERLSGRRANIADAAARQSTARQVKEQIDAGHELLTDAYEAFHNGALDAETLGQLQDEVVGLAKKHEGLMGLDAKTIKARKQLAKLASEGEAIAFRQGENTRTQADLRAQAQVAAVNSGRLVGAEDFTGGKFRVPYQRRGTPKAILSPGTWRGGIPRKPGSLTNAYTDYNRRTGNFQDRTAKLVAESEVEMLRHTGVLRKRNQIVKAAQPEPRGPDWLAVRLDNLRSGPIPAEVKDLQSKMADLADQVESGHPVKGSEKALHDAVETMRRNFVLGTSEDMKKLLHQNPEIRKLYNEGKIGWVPPALLGDYARPALKLSSLIGHKPVTIIDAINNASRLAILYLKPAYAAPNLLGNATLNLVQQGFAAIPNVARSARINSQLSPLAAQRLDAVMGEGLIHSLSGDVGSYGQAAIQKAANFWSKGVDTPFRRSSFLFEARRVLRAKGIKGDWAGIERLLIDPKYEDSLMLAAKRANREIIDYANLSPREREVVRRIIFFYPWVKGSTTIAARLIAEHPVVTSVAATAGEQARKETERRFGSAPPSFLQGAFPVGKHMIVNPAAAAILGTPAQVADTVSGVLGGNVKQSARLADLATPVASLISAESTRIDPRTGYAYSPRQSGLSIAADQLISPLPQETLIRGVSGQVSPNAILQPTKGQAIRRFLVGGLSPTNYSQKNYRKRSREEQFALYTPSKRVVVRANEYRQSFLDAGKAAGLLPKDAKGLPRDLAKAILERQIRFHNYADQGIHRSNNPNYQHEAFEADVKLLVKQKKITQAQGDREIAWGKTASIPDISGQRDWYTDEFFMGKVLSEERATLKGKGHDPGNPFPPP